MKIITMDNNNYTSIDTLIKKKPSKNPLPLVVSIFALLTMIIGLGLYMYGNQKPKLIKVPAEGPNPIVQSCTINNGACLLILHQFDSEAACNTYKDRLLQFVGQPSDPNVCPQDGGSWTYGTTTQPADGKPTQCIDVGTPVNGACTTTYPNCALVQLDCIIGSRGSINGGNPQFQCSNCSSPPTPSPTTPISSPSPTPTPTVPVSSPTPSPTPTNSPTPTPTTPVSTPTPTLIPSPTPTGTIVPSNTPTVTPTPTPGPSATTAPNTPTATPTEIIIAKASTSSPTQTTKLLQTGTGQSFIYIIPALIMLAGLIL